MRTVKTAEFKAHLSEYLAAVRAGETITVCDRNTPIAEVRPIPTPRQRLVVREATQTFAEFVAQSPPPSPIDGTTLEDVVAMLIDNRGDR